MLFVSWPLKDVNLCYPKVDKIFASVLPIGSYPLSVGRISVIVRLSWLVSLGISVTVNTAYPCSYEPAAVLCIPLLPSAFFFTLSSFACFIFICLIVGFSATILFLKKGRFHWDSDVIEIHKLFSDTSQPIESFTISGTILH